MDTDAIGFVGSSEESVIACVWCGLFTRPGPACELCGSPTPEGSVIPRIEEVHSVMVLERPSEPPPLTASPVRPVDPELLPSRPDLMAQRGEPPPTQGDASSRSSRGRDRGERPIAVSTSSSSPAAQPGPAARVRLALDVRWVKEAVSA